MNENIFDKLDFGPLRPYLIMMILQISHLIIMVKPGYDL